MAPPVWGTIGPQLQNPESLQPPRQMNVSPMRPKPDTDPLGTLADRDLHIIHSAPTFPTLYIGPVYEGVNKLIPARVGIYGCTQTSTRRLCLAFELVGRWEPAAEGVRFIPRPFCSLPSPCQLHSLPI
jgi:hypothetical protein